MPLPGDELVPNPIYVTTRAITIHAPIAQVWPWLLQLGQDRGGFYSYDVLENLAGLNIHSAKRIVPEWQNMQVGDKVNLAPNNALPLTVSIVDAPHALVLRSCDSQGQPVPPGDYLRGEMACSWAFILHSSGPQHTRLIIRWRSAWLPSQQATLLNSLVLAPIHFLMERKMLLGIKQRAEAGNGIAPRWLLDRVRQLNKRYYNRFAMRFAGQAGRPYAVVHHVGRRSGRAYSTPVVAETIADGFIIPLPYGEDVDWCRNILAAGNCTLTLNGVDYPVGAPEIVPVDAVLPLVAAWRRPIFRLLGIKQCLRLKRLALPTPAETASAD